MYDTASSLPMVAASTGRYAISTCLPSDGAEPAVVTYGWWPWPSVRVPPSRVRIGSPPSM